ncbi:MAG TPA: hypothetical protein VFZ49_05850 [Pyrinomonadaceae bacterium]
MRIPFPERDSRRLVYLHLNMKGSPIKQNLSTSFVDLSLLVRYLRDRHFTGSIRLEWTEYEAEIFFTTSNRVQAREYDRRIGRIAQGQAAFLRILRRSRQPRGQIKILRNDPDQTAAYLRKAFVDERIIAEARRSAFGKCDQFATISAACEPVPQLPPVGSAGAALLATDLLLTFKEGFERTRISFYPAFAIACGVKCDEHPFLDPDSDQFSFYRDEIFISEKVDSDELFEGVVAALRHILVRVTDDGRFSSAVAYLRHRIQQHLSTRHKDYESLGLVSVVDRLLS